MVLLLATSCLSQKQCSAFDASAKRAPRSPIAALNFIPAFHQVLRQSFHTSRATYRINIPMPVSGDTIRASFQAGDGPLELHAASVRTAAYSQPTALTFSGGRQFNAEPRQLVRTDPIALRVRAGDELFVAFEVEGAAAANSFERFPSGSMAPGGHVFDTEPTEGTPFHRGIGLISIEVAGEPTRAIVAIGDSITEGFIRGHDDIRESWPMAAQQMLGIPVVGAAVSGQGVDDALRSLGEDVLSIDGITDCVILLGTNDLADRSDAYIVARLEEIARRLRSRCQVWVGTILPKEWTPRGDYPLVKQRRQAVNQRLRGSSAQVIDFDAALRDPLSPDQLRAGTSADGIHLTAAGHRLLAEEVMRAFDRRGRTRAVSLSAHRSSND